MKRKIGTLILVVLTVSCRPMPPNLTPTDEAIFRANEMVVAIGTIGTAAIELNKLQRCNPAPCRPMLSTDNTRIVVEISRATIDTINKVPEGWRAVAIRALENIESKLDAEGWDRIAPYVSMARVIITATGDLK